jgi:hypothetical protein
MFQGWRFKLREAEAAADQGQLDEAYQLLVQGELRQYLPGKRLSTRVAGELAQRARGRVIQGDLSAGWRDLQNARSLAGDIGAVLDARREIIALGLGEAESHVENGDPASAIALLETFERLNVHDEPLRWLKDVARRLESARHLALRGKFVEAEAQAKSAETVRPHLEYVAVKVREYHDKIEPFRQLTESLHRALAQEQWTEVVSLADQVLEMAPESRLAQNLRAKAWAQVGTPLVESRRGLGPTRVWNGAGDRMAAGGETDLQVTLGVGVTERVAGRRFLLWIDGVGGYLVCLGSDVLLGQACPDCQVDIPIQADLSRRHARIVRQGDGYVIEPYQATRVNGQTVGGKTLLSDGDEIELAQSVRLRFRQPHALSASARLDFISHHRTLPKADGVLLMAESCVLGPKWQNHVVCRDWQGDVVLYRRDGDLFCRAMDSLEIDGRLCDGRGQIHANSHVSGSDFSMSLEELS